MGKPLRLDGVLAKIESTYRTDAVPTNAANGILVAERVLSTLRIEHVFPGDRGDEANGSIIRTAQPAPRKGRIGILDIAWRIRGAGTAYAAANRSEADPLLRACGWGAVVDATLGAEKITYTIADENHESATIYAYAQGNVYKILGARGVVVWPITAGELGILRFQMRGVIEAAPAAAALPSITYNAQTPIPAVGMAFAIGGWTPDLISAEFNQGADLQQLDDATDVEGLEGFDFGEAAPSLEVTARAVALATANPYSDARTPTSGALSVALGSTQYNRLKLTDSAAWAGDPEHAEDGQFAAWRIPYGLTDPTIVFD